jgi:parallel beta-helix repeat protein
MQYYKLIGRILVVLSLLFVNLFPLTGLVLTESGAPDGAGVTNVTWYINTTDDVSYQDKVFRTMDIQINNSGKMAWDNITAYIDGNVIVMSDAFFNLTDSLLNVSGNISVGGIVNFDNVTLIMNSTYDGEFGINVTSNGTFNVLNNSDISSFDKTTPIDLDPREAGNESYGLHYNFTVYGNLKVNNSFVSYTYGNNDSYLGGIHLYENSVGIITNSTIFENEVSAICCEGNASHLIQNNHIYNASAWTVVLIDHAYALIDNNTIESLSDNFGSGIGCGGWAAPLITRNTIKNNYYDGIYLSHFSNATIINNTIDNNGNAGIYIRGIVFSTSGTNKVYSVCDTKIENNIITNNYNWGIANLISPMDAYNNTITHTRNGSGIWVQSNYFLSGTGEPVGIATPGNIVNNTIQYNDQYGINLSSMESTRYRGLITMDLFNNTITDNNWSGINVMGGRFSNAQSSPNPDIYLNNISYNNHSGVRNYETRNYDLFENIIEWNNDSGVICESSSRPKINNNPSISWNTKYGIECISSSRPQISYNNITHNTDSGVYLNGYTNEQILWNNINDNLGHGIETYASTPNINNNQIMFNNLSGLYLQGGGVGLIVKTNDIFNNSMSGVETKNSNCLIQDNEIIYNTLDGIMVSGGGPTINQNNLVNYNDGNGLACYDNTNPAIGSSEFRFNKLSGVLFENSNPQTSTGATTITNNTWYGVEAINGSDGRLRANIWYNKMDGLRTSDSGTRIELINSEISYNDGHGVNATDNSAPVISNSTISNNLGEAFWLDTSSDPVSMNTSFNKSAVYYMDSASTLTIRWYVHILTRAAATGSAVTNVKVWVNSTTQGSVVWTGRTNNFGWAEWLKITEYVETDGNNNHRGTDPGERTLWTPHRVEGDKHNFRKTVVTPNPSITQSQVVVLRLDSNRVPEHVSNIKPKSTHNSHPTIRWDVDASPDPDPGQSVDYELWVGTTWNTSTTFASPVITQNFYTLPDDLEYDEDGNKTYYITVVVNDDHGGQSFTFNTLYLLNSDPIKPQLNLSLSGVSSVNLESATCLITIPSTDPDGDEINYTYKWYKNNVEQTTLRESNTKATSDSISITTDVIEFKKGDEWEVWVRAEDGLLGISSWAKAKFTIGNLGPRVASKINDIVMNEDEVLTDYFDLTTVFIDPDQAETSLDYEIKVNDVNLTVEKNANHKVSITPVADWNGKTMINFTCVDNEGLWVTQFVNVTVKPVNDEPEFTRIGEKSVLTSILEFTDDEAAIEETWYNLSIVALDVDIKRGEDDAIEIWVSNESVTLTMNPANPLKATLSFYPTNTEVGFFEFMISIKDSAMTKYRQNIRIVIEVKNLNDGPELVTVEHLPGGSTYNIPGDNILNLSEDIDLDEDEKLNLMVTAIDPDLDDELKFSTDSNIVEVDHDTNNPFTAKFTVTPTPDTIGLYKFTISVRDRKLEKDTIQIVLKIDNVNDRPTVKILQPPEYQTIKTFGPNENITFEGEALDADIPYGDSLSYKWESDKDGELGYSKLINKNDLSIGEHMIEFSAEDSFGESSTTFIRIIIGGVDKDEDTLPDDWERIYFGSTTKYVGTDDPDDDGYSNSLEYLQHSNPTDENDPEQQPEQKGGDSVLMLAIVGMAVVIIIVLIILFMFMRKMKRKKAEEEKPKVPEGGDGEFKFKLKDEEFGGPGAGMGMGMDMGPPPASPGADKPGTPPGGVGASGVKPGDSVPKGDVGTVPPQITTCPKCSTVMTFSPDGGMFCIRCGFRPDKEK